MMAPTPGQRRILDYLTSRAPAWVGGYELRDAAAPNADVKVVHVQIHNLRNRCGVAIESRRSCRGGYRLAATA